MTDGQGTKSDHKSSPCHYITGELIKQKGPWALDRSSESLTRRWTKTDHKSSPSHYVTDELKNLCKSTHKDSNSDLVIINAMSRPLVKSALQKNDFLITQPKHMLWVLKSTVSMRRFF